ncbi:hypothetical protein CONPUDRAFT_93794 [Coniophora puteana RWD-64-598 SS2]|uniref:BTB domain-containing protein n=1 Tax=Coniophora puteana (strain RWD-64-598) TaxID=741705 RepID=R7SEI1_CONPW|nr:uncharacterized protein CONPUDRAFT_93794 [Coniophora puteana RWD-64-598 SS2]EIW74591.1 hypothetical protein CONPUDRAFT_93794 [Coniophora puteana RWD-64-598 SS2]
MKIIKNHSEDMSSSSSMRTHDVYFIPSGDVVFLVENRMFKVHSYFFSRESVYFYNLLRGQPYRDPIAGLPHISYFKVDTASAAEFTQFLWVFYDPAYKRETTVPHWSVILKFAKCWGFANIEALAIYELEKRDIEPIEKISLYNIHNLSSGMLLPSYVALVRRQASLTAEEGEKLGLEVVIKVGHMREDVMKMSIEKGKWATEGSTLEESEVVTVIKQILSPPDDTAHRPEFQPARQCQ